MGVVWLMTNSSYVVSIDMLCIKDREEFIGALETDPEIGL